MKYHETYSDAKKMYLVMEYCPRNILDSTEGDNGYKIYSEEEARELMEQLLSAMKHYNAHGIIHRDIKPENIMIGLDGKPRFCDFGVFGSKFSQSFSRHQGLCLTMSSSSIFQYLPGVFEV